MILKKTGNFPAILFHVATMLNVCGETQPQTSEQQGLSAFLQSWNHWLAEKNYSQSDVAMCQTSIDQFLRALEHLGPEFLLTTQVKFHDIILCLGLSFRAETGILMV